MTMTLTQEEIERGKRIEDAKNLAESVYKQCQQMNFTVAQFQKVVSILDFKRQLMEMHAADVTRMKN